MTDQADMEAREKLAMLVYDHMRPEHPLPFDACERIVSFLTPQICAAAYDSAAEVAYFECAQTRHVRLGDQCRAAILSLKEGKG